MSTTEFDSRSFLSTLTHRPGVYRMLDEEGQVLYVGKAKNLKKRVATYFGSKAHHPKTQALMNHAVSVEVTVTGSEQDALLLEYNLIKSHRPRFNVLLRDGKSYPYIHVGTDQDFPRFSFHRGSRKGAGEFFGPFPNAGAVRKTLGQLQKLFRVRQCDDSYFRNRTRPCLQYQIRRCSGPCVDLIDAVEYQRDVRNAMRFLQGKNDAVLADLIERMEQCADTQAYEQAAEYRDQIGAIKSVQAQQVISAKGTGDTDALAVCGQAGSYCVALLIIRGGRVLGSRTFFPTSVTGTNEAEVMDAFIIQHYFAQPPPPEILVNAEVPDSALLETALQDRNGQRVAIRGRVRGNRRRWLELALSNARLALAARHAVNAGMRRQLEALTDVLDLADLPERIECFDISHTGGHETMAACVVFGGEGPMKSDYRRFRIQKAVPGDDYGAIREAVQRRYTRVKKGEGPIPDLVLIDGGKGQVKVAREVLSDLQLADVQVFGVAKGQDRKPGRESIFAAEAGPPMTIPADSPALHLIQQVRDEAHRFAITGHRQRRAKARKTSTLESVDGLGPVRRRAILREFGGLQGVRRAGVNELARVKGISPALALRIYDFLHGGVDSSQA